MGTDLIYKSTKPPFSINDSEKTFELISHSSIRLSANKAIVAKQK